MTERLEIGRASRGVTPDESENMRHDDCCDVIVSAEGSSRGTGYIESNKIVQAAGQLHVAWLDADRGGPEPVRIRTLDLASGKWSAAVTLGEAVDNHGGPALARDGHGYLHTLFGPHHGPFSYRRSLRPDATAEWTPGEQVGRRCTYPSLVCDADNMLHMVCRDSSTPGWTLTYFSRPADGGWSAGRPIIEPTVKGGDKSYRCYRASLYPDRHGVLHLGFMMFGGEHFQDARARGLAGYLRSADAGATWTHYDGTLPKELPTDRDFDRVPVTDNCIRTSNLVVDAQGTPCIVTVSTGFRGYADKWGEALLWKRRPDGWHATPLNPFIEKVCPGHRASWAEPSLSIAGDGRLFIALVAVNAASVDTKTPWHGDEKSIYANHSSRIVLLTTAGGKDEFAARRVGKDVPGIPSWMPSMERFTGDNEIGVPRLLYTHGSSGQGCKPRDAVSEIRLIECACAPAALVSTGSCSKKKLP